MVLLGSARHSVLEFLATSSGVSIAPCPLGHPVEENNPSSPHISYLLLWNKTPQNLVNSVRGSPGAQVLRLHQSHFSDVLVATESFTAKYRLSAVGDYTGARRRVLPGPFVLHSTTGQCLSGCHSGRDQRMGVLHTTRDTYQSLLWRQGAGAKFLKSCSAVTGILNLARLGAARTGFGSNGTSPIIFTLTVFASIKGNK